MPDGTSSQDKLFSHGQSGETLNQSKNHHLSLSPRPVTHAYFSVLATKESGMVKDSSDRLPS